MKILLFFILVLLDVFFEAKVFERCELAQELIRQNFSKNEVDHWVCLVESESTFSTDAIGRLDPKGSLDHGLFQISDKYWCKNKEAGGVCKVKCEDLRNDDITKASKCAKTIFKLHGFSAWVGWVKKCNESRPSIEDCFADQSTTVSTIS